MKRVIARLDVKGSKLIKSVHLEGLRVLGEVAPFAHEYFHNGADEIIFIDLVATLYGRNKLTEIVRSVAKDVFVPLTVGGGVRSLNDFRELLRAGADKVAVNTAAVRNPSLLTEAASVFGSQAVVSYIEYKNIEGKNFIFVENGREKTTTLLEDWIPEVQALGAGEILLTSIDCEGTEKGFDVDTLSKLCDIVNVPLTLSGGFGALNDIDKAAFFFDAVAVASCLHYKKTKIQDIRDHLKSLEFDVREL